jgi:Protein of unknown function (DUF3999)
MNRTFLALTVILAWGASGLAPAAQLHPEDFAYGMPIETRSAGTAYRFTVPVEVFMKVAHEDLQDVRVFNARGEAVPYELRQAAPEPRTRSQGPALPLFPLHGDARASLNGVRVTINSAGAAVDLQTASSAASSARDPHVITSYVLDAREIELPLSGLQLHWADDAPEFSGRARIEMSDDLGSWRLARNDAPVVHLLTGNSELVQSLLEFPSTKAKFWRLTWIGKTAPFELTSVTAQVAIEQPSAPRSTVTANGSRTTAKENERSFDLGAKLPVTEVNLLLPESNSVLKIELLSRARTTDSWHLVTQGEFYRVSTGSSDRNNEPIRIPTDSDRFWLVRQTQPTGPIGDVKLRATWDATDLVFLAQGAGPFVLAYGNASAGPSSVALEPLTKGVTVLPAETGRSYLLGGAERLRPPPTTVPWRMATLWSALGLGVLLLAWMAFRLSRELGPRPTQ